MKFTFLISCIIMCSICRGQDLFNTKNSILFANHLFDTGQYELAGSEFERLVFLDPENDSLQIKLIQSYERSGNLTKGIEKVIELHASPSQMTSDMSRLYLKLLLKNGDITKADEFLRQSPKLTREEDLFYRMGASAYNMDWLRAIQFVDSLDLTQYPQKMEFGSILIEASNSGYKKPVVAAVLSGIIPGAGKFYTRDWKDGLISFIMFAGSGWQSYRSFHRQGSGSLRGWLFTSISAGFYVGNIYGSAKAAKKYNNSLDIRNLQKFEKAFNLYR